MQFNRFGSDPRMPPKRQEPRDLATEHQFIHQAPLLQLPEAVLTLIAEQLSGSKLSMLAASRAARDAVLRSLTKIELRLEHQRSAARLLNRACREASPGLEADLHLRDQNDALPTLLQPALETVAGWTNVYKLWVTTKQATSLSLLGPAMPCLKHLRVSWDQPWEHWRQPVIEEGGLFKGIQACTGLEVLHLCSMYMSPAAVSQCATILGRLPALRELTIHMSQSCKTDPSGFLQQLTCLTSLNLQTHTSERVLSMCTAAARNPALQVLTVGSQGASRLTAAELQHLLASCPSLTTLDMPFLPVSDDVLEVLLTHGKKITTLVAASFRTDGSFADRQCSWKRVWFSQVDYPYYPVLLLLANAPLKGVEELHGGFSDLGILKLPLLTFAPDQVADLLRRATTNIAACRQWQLAPGSFISLGHDPEDSPPQDVIFTPAQRIQLLEALAPLGGPHVKEFNAAIYDTDFEWGEAELQALGRSLNSERLSALQLSYCIVTSGFWAALDEVLPSLSDLYLNGDVTGSDLALFCSKRGQGHMLSIHLQEDLYQSSNGAQLQASLEQHSVANVKVLKW